MLLEKRDGSVRIAARYRLEDQRIEVRFSVRVGGFYLFYNIENGCGAHQVSIELVQGFLSGSKAAVT
jgi:hypothetical protein